MEQRLARNLTGFRCIVAFLAWFYASLPAQALATTESKDEASDQTPQYQLGQGLRLGDSGFVLGGYSTLQYQNQDREDQDSSLSVSHLSAFLWWEGDSPLKFFAELDGQEALATHYHQRQTESRQLALERFYFDYTFSEPLTLRAGKFLTPIGRWNLKHADPLVWTTSRPVISTNIFPDNTTGALVMGNVALPGVDTDYSVYTSVGRDPHRNEGQDPFADAYGAHLNLNITEHSQLGFSYAHFTQLDRLAEHKHLYGLDWQWARDGYELTAEGILRYSSEGNFRDVRGAYLQAVMPVPGVRKLYAVGRLESVRQPTDAHATRVSVVGMNYRFTPTTALKLEYDHADQYVTDLPDGLLLSFCIMF